MPSAGSPPPAVPPPAIAIDALLPPATAVVVHRAPPVRRCELVAMVAIVALADVALYQGSGGAGLAVLFAAVPAILFLTAKPRSASVRFAVIAVALALVAGRCLWQSSTGATTLGMALLLSFAVALRTSRSFLPELAVSALGSVWGSVRQLGRFLAALAPLVRPVRFSRAGSATLYIPAVLVIVFGAIFAAANPVLQRWLQGAVDLVSGIGWAPSPMRIAFWGVSAVAAAGMLRPVVRAITGLDARLGTAHVAESMHGAPAASRLALARNGMIALNALFLAYNALDAVYLWGGRSPRGVTHTEYAHAGTVWLTIAFLLSTIVLGALFRGPIEHDPRGKLARGLAYAWAGQNVILAAGTFRRIAMYIAYSGLTELRIVGILGTSLATLGLAIVVYKVARHRTMLWVMRRQLDALAVAIVVFLVAPTGEIAMRYNVARVAAGQYRPLLHLYKQPIQAEAVPALLPLLDHPDPAVREGVAVIVEAQGERLRAADIGATSWTGFELARRRALAALDGAAADIAKVMPADREAASAQLRGVAYGINDELERYDDEGPFDGGTRRYSPRR
jgi:hypothetical protein